MKSDTPGVEKLLHPVRIEGARLDHVDHGEEHLALAVGIFVAVEDIHLAKLEAQRHQGGEQGRPLQIVTRTPHQVDDVNILPNLLDRLRGETRLFGHGRFIGRLLMDGLGGHMTGLCLVFGGMSRFAGTEGRCGGVSGLDQRFIVGHRHHGFTLGTGTVNRSTAIDLGRLAHGGGWHLFQRLGQRLVEGFLFLVNRRGRNRTGGRLAHDGGRQIVFFIFIEGRGGRTTAQFGLTLFAVELGLGTTATTDYTNLTYAIAVEGIVITIPRFGVHPAKRFFLDRCLTILSVAPQPVNEQCRDGNTAQGNQDVTQFLH